MGGFWGTSWPAGSSLTLPVATDTSPAKKPAAAPTASFLPIEILFPSTGRLLIPSAPLGGLTCLVFVGGITFVGVLVSVGEGVIETTGVAVSVGVTEGVTDILGVFVGVSVTVGLAVTVGVSDAVSVSVGLAVTVGVSDAVSVDVFVIVGSGVSVGHGVSVGFSVFVEVGVFGGISVDVGVAVSSQFTPSIAFTILFGTRRDTPPPTTVAPAILRASLLLRCSLPSVSLYISVR